MIATVTDWLVVVASVAYLAALVTLGVLRLLGPGDPWVRSIEEWQEEGRALRPPPKSQ